MADPATARYVDSGYLDATGACTIEFTITKTFTHRITRVRAFPLPGNVSPVKIPTAVTYINGKEFEGTYSGSDDRNTSQFTLYPQETYACVWTGGDAGARVTFDVEGLQ